jgi:hypothetical protein
MEHATLPECHVGGRRGVSRTGSPPPQAGYATIPTCSAAPTNSSIPACYAVSHFHDELVSLVSGTTARWDADETSRRLELLLGPDLQFIRINGTVVGGLGVVVIATGRERRERRMADAVSPGVPAARRREERGVVGTGW